MALFSSLVLASPAMAGALAFHSIPMARADPGALDLVKVQVENRSEWYLIDTGCARSLLHSTSLAKALGKELRPAGGLEGVGGRLDSFRVDFDSVNVGGRIEVGGEDAHVTAVDHLGALEIEGKPADPQGLVGSPLLARTRAVIDFAGSRILVPGAEVPKDGYRRAMESQGERIVTLHRNRYDYPYVEAEINGGRFAFLLDTGANTNTIEPEVAEELGLPMEKGGREVKGSGTVDDVPVTHLDRLRIPGGVVIGKVKCHVLKTHTGTEGPEGMKLGGILGSQTLHAIKAKLDFGSYVLVLPK